MAALPKLLARAPDQAGAALDALQRIVHATGLPSGEVAQRLEEMTVIFRAAAGEPRPAAPAEPAAVPSPERTRTVGSSRRPRLAKRS